MALDDPYAAGANIATSQLGQMMAEAPLLQGKIQSQLADVGLAKARTGALNQQTDQATALQPDVVAQAGQKTATGSVNLRDLQQQQALRSQTFSNTYLGSIAANIDPNADSNTQSMQFDRGLDAAVKDGALTQDEADQWRGRGNSKLYARLAVLGGPGSTAQLTGARAAGTGLPGDATAPPDDNLTVLSPVIAGQIVSAGKAPDVQAHLAKIQQALAEVRSAANPAAAFAAHAADFGYAGAYSPQVLDTLEAHNNKNLQALNAATSNAASGIPQVRPQMETKTIGADQMEIGTTYDAATNKYTSTTLAKGQGEWLKPDSWQHDSDGNLIQFNKNGQQRIIQGTGGRESPIAQRKALGDALFGAGTREAAAYALGKMEMTPAQQTIAIDRVIASRQNAYTVANAGQPLPPNLTTDALRAELSPPSAAASDATDTAPPAAAVARMKPGVPHPFNNGQTWIIDKPGGKPRRVS